MTSLQQLEEQQERLSREIRAAGDRVRNAQNDEETRQAQADRQVLRERLAVISRQITEIRARAATSFVVIDAPDGRVQIRTSDGLLVGAGATFDEAKAEAISTGVGPEFLNNLVDPRAKAQADQGPDTESAGETVVEAQEANADAASSQSPAPPAQEASDQGEITTAPASTVPSNADPATGPVSEVGEAPGKLPEASLTTSNGSLTNNAGTGPAGTVLQVTTPDISAPEANDNLVSYIYRASRVVSRFQQGRFTQEIEGFQIFFPPGSTQAARAAPAPAPASPNQSAAETQRLQNVAKSQPQGTVAQTVVTPGALGAISGGVTFQNQVGAEFGAFFGDGTTGEPGQLLNRSTPGPRDQTPRSLPASSFAAEGFVDPTQEQPDTVAPLKIDPPTTDGGSVVSPPRRSRSNANRSSQSNTTNTALQQGAREY